MVNDWIKAESLGLKQDSRRYTVEAQIRYITFSSSNYLDKIS